jgi:hypothetical protein
MTIDPRQWKYRRRAVFLILIASLFIIGICAVYGGEDAVRVATVNALSFLIALVAVFYIFTPALRRAGKCWPLWLGEKRRDSVYASPVARGQKQAIDPRRVVRRGRPSTLLDA